MSKRPAVVPMDNSDKKKRKHLCLSIAQKIKLLEKLDSGISVRRLTEEYGIGMTTIYDLKKQKDKLLKFYVESDEPKLMKNRKTLHKAKNEDLDRVLKEWIRQRHREHMPLNGMLIMKQAKIYHSELKIEGNCEYSTGWLQKFKKRHGIKFLKNCNKASVDHKAGEKVIEKVDLKDIFHLNNHSPVVHSLTSGKIAEMVLNQGDRDNSDDEGDVNNTEKVPVDNMVKLCDGLIEGLQQCAFITEQEIMTVYKIKERLLRQKLLLIKQMTLEKTFKKAVQQKASSTPKDSLPGLSAASDVSSHFRK